MRELVIALSLACAIVGCGGGGGNSSPTGATNACATADNLTRVQGASECLVIRTYVSPTPTAVLLVMVHGDVSAGGPADYMYSFAPAYAGAGVTAVALLRPGYFDTSGSQSTGSNFDRLDSYTESNVAAVAGAIQQLKQFHKATRVVYMGHSGGAAIGGAMAGKYPGLLDATLLVGCPCNIPQWRIEHGAPPWPRSLSPHDFLTSVPPSTKVIALTGSLDINTFPHLGLDYVNALRARGVDATYVEVPGAMHDFGTGLRQSVELDASLRSLLAAR